MKIMLDPGHGGHDTGANFNGLIEKNMNLVTAFACKKVLERHGITVNMTRTTDVFYDLDQRCDMANKWGADLTVSIHYNAGGGDGVEAIHSIFFGKGNDLAAKIVQRIHDMTGQNFRPNPTYSRKGQFGTDYYGMIRMTDMPTVIVEGAFLDTEDRFICDTVEEQEKFGVAIAYGILDSLGIVIKPEPQVPVAKPVFGIVTADSGLNVRYGRGTNFAIMSSLKKGTKVELLQLKDGWWSIKMTTDISKTGIGYVNASYIQKI